MRTEEGKKIMAEERPKYWLHRITGGKNARTFAYNLLHQRGLLSIGWSDFSSEENLKALQEKGETKLNELIRIEWNFNYLSKGRHGLLRFINQMHAGEIVVVPQWDGEFSICRIQSDRVLTNETLPKEYYETEGLVKDGHHLRGQNGKTVDVGFYREVEFLEKCVNVSRRDYADKKLTFRMKIRQTNADITEIKDSVKFSIERIADERPINLSGDIAKKTIEETYNIINNLIDSQKYETIVEKYLKAIGADKVWKPATHGKKKAKGGDADRAAVFDALKVKLYVQVKKHESDSKTREWAIQQIAAFSEAQADDKDDYLTILWVITNARAFTLEAKELADNKNVRLITGDEFARMILDIGLKHFE